MNVKMGKWQLLQAVASFFFLALLIIQASSSSAHEGEEELQVPSDGDRTLENAQFEKLQAALLTLNAQKEDLAIDDHNLAVSLDGAKGSEVIGLLQNYAHHLQQKWQQASGDDAGKEVQAEEEEEELLSQRTLTKQGFSEADYIANQEPVNVKLRTTATDEDRDDETVHQSDDETLKNAQFEKLQAALLALNAQKEDLAIDDHNLAMSLDGAKGSEVIGLLQNYAHHLQQKWQQASGDDAGKEVQAEEEEELLSQRTLTKQGFSEADYSANQEPVNVKLRTTRTDEDRDDETVHQSEVGSHTLNPDVEARDRLHKLEESLKAVAARGSPEQGNDEQSIVLNTEGVAGHEVINLLQKYAHQMHQKMQQTGDVSFDDHGDHHMHKHDQSHKHEGHDSHVHQHHTNGHSHDSHVHQSHGNRHSHHHHVHHSHENVDKKTPFRLPEEIEEERDLQEYGFEGRAHSDVEYNSHFENWDFALWMQSLGSSLLVSMASLICLILLPCIVSNGKPSPTVVDALAAFGAGAMLGDAFLHQLPHAFGDPGSHHNHNHVHDHLHSHMHINGEGHSRGHSHPHGHSQNEGHGHSMQDLSVGLAILGGILLFFIVEKIVRRVEELSSKTPGLGHAHHHHSQKKQVSEGSEGTHVADGAGVEDKEIKPLESNPNLRKRTRGETREETSIVETDVSKDVDKSKHLLVTSGVHVMGYLNLFSDAVHNFTDGMSLGTAFLLHGTVGGWSRTLFLLAHELPQEVGDFGILVRSGFSVFKALAFNFLSALVAMAGTALALSLGGNPGHSSLIEGFTAGGFIYISVAGVMPDMHTQGNSLSTTLWQLTSMILGMGVAVVIALAE
ncbi:hypothetical protein CY35_06G084100 [Sphagnum magellanicum]|nr:hypothetical protein CY35_06G084100 [Sphagnum magellanicum]